jgi:PAS domain S-box-containing protein
MRETAELRSAAQAEIAHLSARLQEAEDTLGAIRNGEVDALLVTGATGPQIYALQGQDAETNRFRGEMLAQVSDAVIAVDHEERIIYLNTAAERLYGFAASEALGRRISSIRQAHWLRPEDEAAATFALREHGEWRGENIHLRNDGTTVYVESGITMLRENPTQPAGMLAVIRDVTERKLNEGQVLVSEIRYRRLFETAHDGILLIDPSSQQIIDANPFMTTMLGYSHAELVGRELFEIGLLNDQAASREMMRTLKRTNHVRYDNLPLESQAGRHQEVEVIANLYDENGRQVIQCNIRDISERRRSEEHIRLLIAEVNHRAKNLLAVVQAVAQQTAKHGDPETLAARLSERIDGLAAGQDLLVKNQWQGVEVSELIMAQLAHFQDLIGTRVLLVGPPARLNAAAAQGIGMALHELTTNAVKYGALSNAEGRVRIGWQVMADELPVFSMSWLEEHGPKVAPPVHKGFGQVVIGRMAEAAVQGTAVIAYNESGLAWTITAAAADTLTPTQDAP